MIHENRAFSCTAPNAGNSVPTAESKRESVDPVGSLPNIADEVREEVIKHYFAAMTHADTMELKRFWCARMNEQVLARSPAVVAKMEAERGLR